VDSLSLSEVARRLKRDGLALRIGPVTVSLRSPVPSVARHCHTLYGGHALAPPDAFIDFPLSVASPSVLRRWLRPQVQFQFDGLKPFFPLPAAQAAAQFEWGLNWCLGAYCHQYALIHSAVVEKNGVAVILPGSPGSGKSTLCAAMVARGWRLFSDETALLRRDDHTLQAIPRPISLKNQSIDIIRDYAPGAVFGERIPDTLKGDISHMQPPAESLARQDERVTQCLIVFPHYRAGAELSIVDKPPADTCLALIEHCFNANVLGDSGFATLVALVDRARAYDMTHSSLDAAIDAIDGLLPG
jgi:hypothetical protein